MCEAVCDRRSYKVISLIFICAVFHGDQRRKQGPLCVTLLWALPVGANERGLDGGIRDLMGALAGPRVKQHNGGGVIEPDTQPHTGKLAFSVKRPLYGTSIIHSIHKN